MRVGDRDEGWGPGLSGSGFEAVEAPCPYGLSATAVFLQARLPSSLSDSGFSALLGAGFRRNGDFFYRPACPACRSCIPIRLESGRLDLNRSQRRNLKKNRDLRRELAPLEARPENLELLARFFKHRFPGQGNDPLSYYSSFFFSSFRRTAELRYFDGERFIATAIIDLGHDFLNCVYFYFDPAVSFRGPGIFNILTLHRLARERNIGRVYLGLWLKEVDSMNYKANFLPHFLLRDGVWQEVRRA